MLTATQNLFETLKTDGKPDRLVNQFQPFVQVMGGKYTAPASLTAPAGTFYRV